MIGPSHRRTNRELRAWARAVGSITTLGACFIAHAASAQEKQATKLLQLGNSPKPTESTREVGALKLFQSVTSGPPPLAPTEFSPDFGARMFLPSIFAEPAAWQMSVTTNASTALPPWRFNPDLGPAPLLPPWLREREELRFRSTRDASPPALPPMQFNPDPGAWRTNTATPPEPFFRNELGTSPRAPFGSAPVPAPLMLPRERARVNDWLRELEPPPSGYGFTEVPRDLRLPREHTRENRLGLKPPAAPSGYGLEPLPRGLELPRVNTRRNLRIDDQLHPHAPPPDASDYEFPANAEAQPDRWRVPFAPWKRYPFSDVDSPYFYDRPALWHPYRQSILKGDVPLFGRDIFLNLTASAVTEYEGRTIPTPSGVSAAQAGTAEFFGKSEQMSVQNNLAFSVELFKGETSFKPVEWAVRLTPVYNVNYVQAQETGVVSPDPRGVLGGGSNQTPPPNGGVTNPSDIDKLLAGQTSTSGSLAGQRHTQRTRDFIALQEWFAEVHLHDLSDNYDFFAMRLGNQTFNSDFRGFLFNDTNLGLRVFGNADNNRWQYNVAGFDLREKDTNSELNTFDARNQQVLIANIYRQDFLWSGYTAQASFHFNNDAANTHYDRNGNIVRPAPIGEVREHTVKAYYLGWGGDGHIGRWNVSHQFYQALGRDSYNGLAGRPVDINAQMAALELSYDRDWLRYKASLFYASGDDNANDGHATGFDTILDNPNFFGGPFSYYVRQGFNLAGTSVGLKQRGSLVPDLRTSKTEGQANFVNPGALIIGLGLEADITPKLKGFLNANYIRFATTDTIKAALLTDKVDRELGYDLSLGFQYRPLLTDNIIVSTGFGALIPGRGYRDIYQTSTAPVPGFDPPGRAGRVDDFLYSGIIAITLTY